MKRMKKFFLRNIFPCLMALAMVSCSQEMNDVPNGGDDVDGSVVYKMKLNATWDDYADAAGTRAGFSWTDGAKVYLRFNDAGGVVKGVATYEVSTDTWNVKPDRTLTAEELSVCEAYHFVNPSSSSSLSVGLTAESVIYADTAATYLLDEDILSVTAVLSPKTGRVRFKGTEGQTFGVTGLSYYSAYNISSNTFTAKAVKVSDKVESDGYSSFYYVYFTDGKERSMVFDYVSTASYKRVFDEAVLSPGTSGFLTIPTLEKHDNWTLVSVANGNEITLPVLSELSYSSIKSSSVYLEASVTDLGNGTLSEVGFVCATHSEPTLDDTKLACGKGTTFAGRLQGLTPQTLHYARPYAINEAGTVYGEVVSFTTKEAPQGSKIEVNDFPEESNWD